MRAGSDPEGEPYTLVHYPLCVSLYLFELPMPIPSVVLKLNYHCLRNFHNARTGGRMKPNEQTE